MIRQWLERIASNKWSSLFLLLSLSSFYLIGLGKVHLFDWDEINFAESAREMIESGDYLRVQINYLPFWEKPPFFFWLQVGAMKIFGVNEFAARLPNALFGFLYLWTFYRIGKFHYNAKFGLIWALVFFGSLLPHLYFKSGIIDPVFNYFILLSVYFLMRVVANQEESMGKFALFAGVCSGLSIITKGPVGFLLLALTFFVYFLFSRFKNIPKIRYFLLFFLGMSLIVGTWIALEVSQNGFAILQQFIDYQLELFNSPVAGHEQPFYYHFVLVAIGCFPISMLALPSFFKNTDESPYNFRKWMLCLFWVVMILFSLSSTKIAHYSSMCYAPLAFLAALEVWNVIEGKRQAPKYVGYLLLIIGTILSCVFIVLPLILHSKQWLIPKMNDPFAAASLEAAVPWTGWEALIGVFLLVVVCIGFVHYRKNRISECVAYLSVGMGCTLLLVLLFILPKAESISQKPAIDFYESIAQEECYVECFGYKSYAQYYYAQKPVTDRKESQEMEWLLTGEIDKPVYMVSKINNVELDDHPNFRLLKITGGFRIYKREIPVR